ncbi:MAG: YfhO family protein [FCB group bacterium]|jgi:hypothetical protein|nr:YfhO family protein [FCB group bacterium]
MRHSYSPGRVFLMALLFIGAAPLFWQRVEFNPTGVGEARENADLYQYVYPTYFYGSARLKAGEIPQWNPQQNCGTPYLADVRAGVFQPLNALFLVMPTQRAMAMHAFVSLTLMGVFFALFARSIGLSYAAALIGGLAYAFSGASAAAMSRPALAATLAWAPFVFWTVGEFVRYTRSAIAVMAGLGFAALILAGAPALAIVMTLLLAAYVAVTFGAVPERERLRDLGRCGVGLLLSFALALAVSAVQWAPSVAWIANGGAFDASFWNMHAAAQSPSTLVDLLRQLPMARPGTLPRLAYFGIATLLLVPAAFAHRPLRRYVILFGVTVLVSFGAMLVDPSVVPGGFPPLSFAYAGVFSVATLAAIGADRLLTVRREGVRPGPWVPAALVFLAALLLFVMFPGQVRGYVLAFLAILLFFLAIRRRWAAAVAGFLFAFLLFIDLVSATDDSYSHPYQDAPQCYARYEEAVRVAREQSVGGRTLVLAPPLKTHLPGNLGMISGLRLVGGRDLPETAALRKWRERALGTEGKEATPALLNYASTRVLLISSESAPPAGKGLFLRQLPTQGDLSIHLNENALPRAYWVPYCRTADGVDAALDVLTEPAFDNTRLCVVDPSVQDARALGTLPAAPVQPLPPETPAWRDAPCSIQDVSPEQVNVSVTAPRAGIVVLADTYTHGWEVAVDGVRCPLLRVNGAFRGVVIPEGRHEVTFRYRAQSFELASALSIATLALVSALGAAGLYRAEHQGSVTPNSHSGSSQR